MQTKKNAAWRRPERRSNGLNESRQGGGTIILNELSMVKWGKIGLLEELNLVELGNKKTT